MKGLLRPLYVLSTLVFAMLACNLPTMGGGADATPVLPAPNQTLTALFAITPQTTPTNTLPPIITATSANQPADTNPTATQVSAQPGTVATATQVSAQPGTVATATQISAQPGGSPTAASAPTATRPAPAATATIPAMRPRSPVTAKFLSTPPTLDGDWSEWKDLTTEYPATNVVYGQGSWANQDDLAGSFHVGWDNNNLYIAVKVRDDVYAQNASGENIFKGDCIEILLDTKLRDDFYYSQLSADDFQLGLAPGNPDVNGTREAYLWFPNSVAGSKTGVKLASRSETGLYRIEAAIPWSVFEVTPAEGMHLGFALSISDNDNTGENIQQSMVSNVSGRRLTDPTTWGDLLLSR